MTRPALRMLAFGYEVFTSSGLLHWAWPTMSSHASYCDRAALVPLWTGCGPPVSGRNPDDPVLRDPCRVRQNRCGDCVMDATLVLIDSDAELARARVLVDRLWKSDLPTDIARLQAQARLIAAYEESKWPRRPPSTGNLIRHLMDQHGLTRADMVPILGTPSRVSEVLGGKKGLSMAMVQRLRARFHVPADLLLPPLKKAPASRSTKQAAA